MNNVRSTMVLVNAEDVSVKEEEPIFSYMIFAEEYTN